MVFGKIKPTATIVAQFAAGVEVDAIQHEGRMYFPVVGMGEFAVKESAGGAPEPSRSADAPAEKSSKSSKSYKEDELMEMESKALEKILRKEFNVDPDDFEGKNTNKKLRNLILDAQDGKLDESDSEQEEKPAKSEKSKKTKDDDAEDETDGDGSLQEKVAEILEDFDAGKKNKKKSIAAIAALSEDADEDKISTFLTDFEEDGDADLDEKAKEITDYLQGKGKKSGKPTKSKKVKDDEDLVDIEDLEAGDRVSVWWNDDNQEWFDGTVKSVKKGKVVIDYDDDTTEAIDPDIHTKIKRLAE